MKKFFGLILSATVLLSSLVNCNSVVSAGETSYKDSIDSYISKYEAGLASCEVAVFDSSGTTYSGYYGYSDIENKIPADDTTVYEWGSSSKLLVWVSVMQLWEQGRLDLDRDIREYLPENFLTKLQYENEKISMINLMNHNAGFQESFYEDQSAAEDELFDSLEEAVKKCECYQAYHVGEHTAYSNWGTSLAAYIVECVSGENYSDYVHKHIFKPLDMKQTSIDPHISDNEYVSEKRKELKCCYRGAESKYNEDYGICNTWVQLYPAGAAIGTLSDYAKFGEAFIADDCPFFDDKNTRNEMFSATSFYGDTDIAKNCHGLWTSEYGTQVLGHAGNTSGCSSNLLFDPVRKIGVVIMTNEPGETIFNYGIPKLVFGAVTQRKEFQNYSAENCKDISGIYTPKRCISDGAGMLMQYTGGLFPWVSDGDGKYSMKLFGFDMDVSLTCIGENMYLMEKNGMEIFLYHSFDKDGNDQLEMMSTDYVLNKKAAVGMLAAYGTMLFGVICAVMLIIKFISCCIRKLRKTEKRTCTCNRQITVEQVIYCVTSVILLSFIGVLPSVFSETIRLVRFSCITAVVLALLSVANCAYLIYNVIKIKEVKTSNKIKNIIWALLCIAYCIFIFGFRFYNFWDL